MTIKENKHIAVSVIIPAYNVGEYLGDCIQSVVDQSCSIEIIVVNDGSTDHTLTVAQSYKKKYDNITIINQEHSGASIARNRGLAVAKGEYIAFIDSDDWVSKNSLLYLFQKAKKNKADMILGNMMYCYPDGTQANIYDRVPAALKNKIMSGSECFISLMKSNTYYPMACGFIYRREWIEESHFLFEKNIIHEDELWTQVTLCLAETIILSDLDFYYYRKRKGSIMHTLDSRIRLTSLFHIAKLLIEFASQFKNNVLKSWIYVNTYRIYSLAFRIQKDIKDSSVTLPAHSLYAYCHFHDKMPAQAKKRCHHYYMKAKFYLQEYYKWLLSPYNYTINKLTEKELNQKRILLIYNNPEWNSFCFSDISSDYVITTDRKYYNQAYALVLHLPDIQEHMEKDLDKPDGQLWVAWSMECEDNYHWMKNEDILALFDIRMDYRQDADVVCPYYANIKKDIMPKSINVSQKKNKICMLISSSVNQSKRLEYLGELMQYIDIESYGKIYNNKTIEYDNGRETKLDVYSKYKFVIAFENTICRDYVTQKFYDPLLAGSVPIYLGAPNIEEFTPGDNCYINTNNYSSPRELASYLKKCFIDDEEYMKYHKWRKLSFHKSFTEKVKIQDTNPFVRLCNFLDKKNKMNVRLHTQI